MSANYGWIIDVDLLEDGADVGTMGPGAISPEIEARLLKGEGLAFRLYSDDRELYYEGRIITTEKDGEEFQPLDDFGAPNAGCTYIMYPTSRANETTHNCQPCTCGWAIL